MGEGEHIFYIPDTCESLSQWIINHREETIGSLVKSVSSDTHQNHTDTVLKPEPMQDFTPDPYEGIEFPQDSYDSVYRKSVYSVYCTNKIIIVRLLKKISYIRFLFL